MLFGKTQPILNQNGYNHRMTTKNDIENYLKDAMRSGDDVRKRTFRMVLAAIKLAEVDRRGTTVDEAAVAAILLKEIKSRKDSISEAERVQRFDIVQPTQAELAVLEALLPQAVTPEELEQMARQAIAEVGATSPREMGLVMKTLLVRLQGRASGDQVSQVVRKLLQGA